MARWMRGEDMRGLETGYECRSGEQKFYQQIGRWSFVVGRSQMDLESEGEARN
jgi:hypothetical protein